MGDSIMASIIRATTTSGLQIAPDNSGSLQLQTNGTTAAVTIDTSQNLQFNSGYGSVATAYGCRAWVNFNGSGTVAVIASGNVSSITDGGTGQYTINFTSALVDNKYSIVGTPSENGANNILIMPYRAGANKSTTVCAVQILIANSGFVDPPEVNIAVFR
jgi:hypothetical protein